jgi:hypothetical protein
MAEKFHAVRALSCGCVMSLVDNEGRPAARLNPCSVTCLAREAIVASAEILSMDIQWTAAHER